MVGLPNLSPHPDGAVDMPATGLWREIISNVRDRLIQRNAHDVAELDVTAGGTFVLSITNRYAKQLIRLIGSPGAGVIIEMADGNKQMEFENTTGQIVQIDSATGATPTASIAAGTTALVHLRGIEVTILGIVGLQVGALLHSGQVNPTATINFADFELKQPHILDYAFVVTSPSSAAGTLLLDIENGNYFDVTLTEDVTTLTLSNPANTSSPLLMEDGNTILLEDGSGELLLEGSDAAQTIVLIARQNGTGGWDITWPASVIWERDTGELPAQTTAPNAVDIYQFLTFDGGATWFGSAMGLNMG